MRMARPSATNLPTALAGLLVAALESPLPVIHITPWTLLASLLDCGGANRRYPLDSGGTY